MYFILYKDLYISVYYIIHIKTQRRQSFEATSSLHSVRDEPYNRKNRDKTFESVSEKWVKTSYIPKKLNLQLVEQRQSTFSPESLILSQPKYPEISLSNLSSIYNCPFRNTFLGFLSLRAS